MKLLTRPLFILLCFLIQSSVFAQDQFPIVNLIDQYSEKYPWEKIYLHTDKPHYFLNDTIWIKAYGLIESNKELPEATPTMPLYVDLIDGKLDRLVNQIIIKMEDGTGQGDFVLPRDLVPGAYTIRAYTQWMRNFGTDAFFQKDIWVGDLGDGWEFRSRDPELNLQFFPEGGNLINGIKSKVGFKATNVYGKGTDIIGYVLDAKKDTLLRFESEYLGMGQFMFTPQNNQNYEVVAKSVDKDWTRFRFSTVQSLGYVLEINPFISEDEIEIKISHNLGKGISGEKLHLLGLSKGKVVYHGEFDGSLGSNSIVLDKDDFMPGLVTFTLMDEETTLLAERLVYMLPFARGSANFYTENNTYKPKDWVKMEIEVMDEFESPIEGNFSISVTDAYQVMNLENSQNIYSYLQLSSEVKGEIEEPYYYFNPENKNAEKYLDNLLLTQGWRRFSWEHLARLKKDPEYAFEPGLSIGGKVFRANDKPIQEPHNLTLMIDHGFGTPFVHEGVTDEVGNFSFIGLDYQDSVSMYLQAFIERDRKSAPPKEVKNNEVEFWVPEKPISEKSKYISFPNEDKFLDFDEYMVTVKEAKNLMEQFVLSREIELGEVTVRGRRSSLIPDNRAIQYNDNPDLSLIVTEDFYSFQNIFQLLRGRFPGVNVAGDVFSVNPPPAVLVRGGAISGSGLTGATFFLDGNPAMIGLIANLPVPEIERIDVLRSLSKASVYGADGAGGVINVLTKSGNPNRDFSDDPTMGNASLETKGYAPVREFYTPSAIPDFNAPIAIDYRSTIFWAPNINTNERGKAAIEFPLSEGSPEVRINLEGLSKTGEPIRATYQFKVN
ncbi:TonB-dependent receptor plug domain-containing protein [Aquiflexum lacus]|uniref:TonB-dependent receptor plug domain-containing protein n=1 Tax=Aquiflexum lacus TaxID=2483805 RepID=UPI00189317A2|nr:TonB-dependent receptor plug domain-containing protein [Aquiflexum lacus]